MGGVLIVLLIVCASVFARVSRSTKATPLVSSQLPTTSITESAPVFNTHESTISLTAGTVQGSLPIQAGDTLYAAMLRAQKTGTLSFVGKEYPGLGYFVTTIGSLTEGSGKYLMYFVNGKDASVGISTYVPKNGDTIIWKLQ